MPMGIQTARDRVKVYCRVHAMKQRDFGELLNLCPSTFQRFMGAGTETTGKGSLAYKAISRFFHAEDRKHKKDQLCAQRGCYYYHLLLPLSVSFKQLKGGYLEFFLRLMSKNKYLGIRSKVS